MPSSTAPRKALPPLKDYLIDAMGKYEIPAVRENILFTNGSQQALDFIGRVFINEGDKIITGRPTYLGAIQAWNVYGPEYVTVPLDDDGMRMDELEKALEANPGVKFIYVLPNFHNPAGTTLPLDRRLRLVELAAEHGAFIVEDDPYGELRFEGEDITPIFALHKENTIYLSTFSKTLAPGLRLGWIVAPERIMAKLVQAKQGADLQHQHPGAVPGLRHLPAGPDPRPRPQDPRRSTASAATSCSKPWRSTFPPKSPGPARRVGCSCGCGCPNAWMPRSCSRLPWKKRWPLCPGTPSTPAATTAVAA